MEGKYFKKIVGQKCYLSPISLDDADYFTGWLNDFSILMNLNSVSEIVTFEKEKELLKDLTNGYVFAIVDCEKNKLMGSIGLSNVDLINRTAEFGIMIGDRNFLNKGYGTEATLLMLDFGFNILNLCHIHTKVYGFNQRAIKCYEKAGFKTVGKFSEYRQIAGERFDMHFMEILCKDFNNSLYIQKTFSDVKSGKTGLDLKLM